MKQLLAVVMAGTFGFIASAPVVLAAEKANPALAKACKGKKEGASVTVDGKKVKGMASGGSASARADGIAQRGKTRGKMV